MAAKNKKQLAAASLRQQGAVTIVQRLLRLQCEMQGCRRPVSQWEAWAKRTLPGVWQRTAPSPMAFCLEVHRIMVGAKTTASTTTVKFQDWRWDFLSALFEEETCNCVCGTLYILSAAEYVGLFPDYVHAMVGPNHIWVTAATTTNNSSNEWEFIETTLRPGHERWSLTPARARCFDIYARGAWYPYCTAESVVQEAFINQIITSVGRQEVLAPKLWHLLSTWAEREATAATVKKSSTKKGRGGQNVGWVLDLQQMRLQQMTHLDAAQRRQQPSSQTTAANSYRAQAMLSASIVQSMHTIQIDRVSRRWDVGPEAYIRSLAALAQWSAWAVHCCGLPHLDDDKTAATQRLRAAKDSLAFVRTQTAEMLQRLQQGKWSLECPVLYADWTMLKRMLSFCAAMDRASASNK